MADSEDRTKQATDRRLLKAREDGQAPLSKELTVAAGLAAATLVAAMGLPALGSTLTVRLHHMLEHMDARPEEALKAAAVALMGAAGPLLGAVLLVGSLAVLLQTSFLLHGKAMLPDLGRLDPRRGLKRLFGLDNAVEAVKSLVKLGALGWVAWHAVSSTVPGMVASLHTELAALPGRLLRDVVHLLLLVLACQAVIAVLDVAWVRFRFNQRLRMSQQEIKQEQKEAEGDPRYKAKLRQLRMMRSRRRMMAAVSKAAVVVTNPTHYAVALAYERGAQAAPRVVAKGVDDVAARIRAAAQKHGVPLVANPPLARALHLVPLDAEVPAEHFKAVAEIIAYIWRLRGASAARST